MGRGLIAAGEKAILLCSLPSILTKENLAARIGEGARDDCDGYILAANGEAFAASRRE